RHKAQHLRQNVFPYCWGQTKMIALYLVISNRASLTLQPNWPQIFSGETITFRCEIQGVGDTQWTYEWKTPSSEKPSNQNEHSIWSATVSHSGEYRCKGRMKHAQQSSTDWSDPIKLTVLDSKSHHIYFNIIQCTKWLFG
uniref:Ig-like domain-containing protein n=1 Tax=Dicentrarchus labrax TaxID=13489 RepID=A0A8C4DT89_DICLA